MSQNLKNTTHSTAMKLTHVVTACNNNPKYTKFIPLFIERWNKLYPGVTVIIVFIATKLPAELEKYSANIRLFSPINHINTAFCAQVIRLLVPCLLTTSDGILLTDIDMLPGNSTYFQRAIESYTDTFISLRPYRIAGNDQIAMCYVVAPRNIWTDIFNIQTAQDIRSFLTSHYRPEYDAVHGGNAWYSDQQILYNYVTAWEKRTFSKAIFLDDSATEFNRLDYFHHNYNKSSFLNLLNTNKFSDAHLYAHECTWSPDDIKQLVSENVPSTTRRHYNLIFLIIDSDDHPVYKESRDIMRQYIHKFDNVLAYFIRFNEELTTEYAVDGDTLLMRGKETFIPGILEKTIKAVEFCRANYSFDYIVRTNLSSFWNIPKLQEKIRNTRIDNVLAYIGLYNKGIQFPAGAGFIMTQNMCNILVQYKDVLLLKIPYIDDVAIGILLQSIKIPITPGSRCDIINEHETITMEQVRAAVNSDNYHYRIKGLHTRNFESRVHQMLCDAVYATLL